jgi:GT2 family glycosyltransferase
VTVTVVIPLFNKAPYISRALESVIGQSFTDFECLVVDDGSTDQGGAIVEGFRDPRIRLIRQANAGVSAARNRGVEEARRPLIAFLDADDEWQTDFLAESVEAMKRYPEAVASFSNFMRAGSGGPVFRDGVRESRLLPDYFAFCLAHDGLGIWSSAVMVRREALRQAGGFPTGRTVGEDLDTWARLAWSGPIAYIPRVLSTYHVEAGASSSRSGEGCDILDTYTCWKAAGRIPRGVDESSVTYVSFLRLLDYHAAIGRKQTERAHVLLAGLPPRQRLGIMGSSGRLASNMRWLSRPLLGLARRVSITLMATRWKER